MLRSQPIKDLRGACVAALAALWLLFPPAAAHAGASPQGECLQVP